MYLIVKSIAHILAPALQTEPFTAYWLRDAPAV